MSLTVTMLGCGTSTGVPRLPDDWGNCDPSEPKNRRRRPSILVQSERASLVVDTGPDFREQMLDAGVKQLDAVLYTHDHADHTHGIDDLRGFFFMRGGTIPVYADKVTLDRLTWRFDYVFTSRQGYPVMAEGHAIDGRPFEIGDIPVQPFRQSHGPIDSLGFRFGPIAYSTDVSALDEAAFDILAGVKVWIVDAVRYRPHPSHAHLDRALAWIERVAPSRAILTHMANDLDYRTLQDSLPAGVEPGYDGLVIRI